MSLASRVKRLEKVKVAHAPQVLTIAPGRREAVLALCESRMADPKRRERQIKLMKNVRAAIAARHQPVKPPGGKGSK